MILPGLTPEEQRSLILSVGTHKRRRELSPVEVARLMEKAKLHGASTREIAEVCHLTDTSMVPRFLRLLNLPELVQTWVAWEPDESQLSLTTAQEIARISDGASQQRMATLILENRLRSKETGHAVMRMQRAKEDPDTAIAAVVKLRPTIRKRFVFVATVTDPHTRMELSKLNQNHRNEILADALRRLGLQDMKGTLGSTRFTVVADEAAAEGHTADSLEASLGTQIRTLLA